MEKILKIIFFVLLSIFITGCNEQKHKILYKEQKRSAIKEQKMHVLDEDTKRQLIEQKTKAYKLQTADRLIVNVIGHPEFSTLMRGGGEGERTVVDIDGYIQLPYIGRVKASDRTVTELTDDITKKLKQYLKFPEVNIVIAHFYGIRYYLLGEFNKPGVKSSDRPLNLLEVLALADGVKLNTANLRKAYVVRNNQKLPVNLYRLIKDGDVKQNIPLVNGDIVMVMDNTNEVGYVVGEVQGQPAGRTVPFVNGELTILQAISFAGYSVGQEEYATLKNVHVIRPEADRVEHFLVDVDKILEGEALPFRLVPGDIVYVAKSNVGSFNLIIKKILPVLDLASKVLNPIFTYKNIQAME